MKLKIIFKTIFSIKLQNLNLLEVKKISINIKKTNQDHEHVLLKRLIILKLQKIYSCISNDTES